MKRTIIENTDYTSEFLEKTDLVQNNLLTYDSLLDSIQGWIGYAMWANTYRLRKEFMDNIYEKFYNKIADRDIDEWLKTLQN